MNANLVENYPGFPGGIPGAALVQLFQRQASNLNLLIHHEEVTNLAIETGNSFLVETSKHRYHASRVVIASGTIPHRFRDFIIPENLYPYVFYEVYPLLDVSGKQIVIVGAGDAAFDYALNLARRNQVTILNRGQQIKCLPLLWHRTNAESNITYREGTAITKVELDPISGILLSCTTTEGMLKYQADYLIGAIGRHPALEFMSEQVQQLAPELEDQGLLYRVGDVKNGLFRQTAIAVGDGIKAAMRLTHLIQTAV
jgi:thioredoxin reductase (NADPH)